MKVFQNKVIVRVFSVVAILCTAVFLGMAVAKTARSQNSGAKEFALSHRNINDLNWMEFRQIVPDKITTVLLPVGTIEAHGVINNGADNTVPQKLAELMAPRINALVAPIIPYGVTGSLARYPGSFKIDADVFGAYCEQVLLGLAQNGFKNIVVLNGHGPNRTPLNQAAEKISQQTKARILVFDWWSYTADITEEVYGQEGGHAGINENAAVMAIDPTLVHKELYSQNLATPIDPSYTAYPFPSSILLYKAGEGYPDFDRKKAERYFKKVVDKCTRLIQDFIKKWGKADL